MNQHRKASSAKSRRFIVGCMTGTSLDGLDAALVVVEGHGLKLRARLVGMASRPLGELRNELKHLAGGGATEAVGYLRDGRRLGELHAEVVQMLLERERVEKLDFVVAHGQTIWHAPAEGLSWQLLDPWPIVRRIGAPVLYDLRQADLIAGGQGAPITPLSDWVLYRSKKADRLIVNLGGICNVTILPAKSGPEGVKGGDIGPCNLLIDGVVRALWPGMSMDRDGALAARGRASGELGKIVRESSPFFARSVPHSTGREDFTEKWVGGVIEKFKARISGWKAEDIVASAVEAVVQEIAGLAKGLGKPVEIILAGGGARNPVLVRRIREVCAPAEVKSSDELGIPIEAREALGFAVLGALTQDGICITLPQVTGAEKPGRAGTWAGL